jgi:uncharacterized pyridoxamine 5'-phosphate oxidase family protein
MIPQVIKEEIWKNLDEYRIVYFATSLDGQPSVRPLTMVPLHSELWILTGMKDAKIGQLTTNPRIEVCMPLEKNENTGYVRFCGRAEIVQDMDIKRDVAEQVDFFKHYWKTPEDPTFALLKMDFSSLEFMRPGEITASRYSL